MRVISLGWGVQSFTLAAMAALGEIEPVDYVIHADTTHECSSTYTFATKWTPWLEEHGVKVITVTPPDASPVDQHGGMMLPAFMDNTERNKRGRMDRQCTSEWKIMTMRRWIQEHRKKVDGKLEQVTMLLGISKDEFWRAKDSGVQYITNTWPLFMEKDMTRVDCVQWLRDHDLELPTKSACVFCPLQNYEEWSQVYHIPDDWQHAIEADELIRKSRPPYDLYVHKYCKPLAQIDFSTPEERGQMSLFNEECDSGYCFL